MFNYQKYYKQTVALFTRAWIEMSALEIAARFECVALFTRAWIEI